MTPDEFKLMKEQIKNHPNLTELQRAQLSVDLTHRYLQSMGLNEESIKSLFEKEPVNYDLYNTFSEMLSKE